MNRRTMLLGLAALLMVGLACDIFPTPDPNSVYACDPNGCISLGALSTNISNALQGQVAGYVSIVGTLPSVFSGQARTTADPPALAMLPNLPSNVASVSKVLTTIAVFQSLRKQNSCVSCALDDPIFPYLWPDWQKAAGPGINLITFRNLLAHRSGFQANCDGSQTTYAVLQKQITQGITETLPAPPSYNNCNFAIFRELLPFMEGSTYRGQTVDGPPDAWSANFYINYMNQHVFQPVGISTSACKPPAGTNDILSYPFPTGSAHGDDWGDWTLACGGGGWVLSAGDLFKVVNDLANGNVLLTSEEKAWMNLYPCLGWDCSVRGDCPTPYACKNGGLNNGSIKLATYLGIFKCTVPVVVIVNSQTPGNADIIDIVANAYKNAAVNPTPSGVPISVCPVQPSAQVLPRVQPTTAARPPTPLPAQTQRPVAPLPTTARTLAPTPRDSQAPRPPILLAPIDGAARDCGQLALTWKPAVDPSGIRDYDVELEKLADRSYLMEKSWHNVRAESVAFDASCDTHFRWRARATDNAGNQGAWSGYAYFRTRASLAPAPAPTRTPLPRDTQAPPPPVQLAPLDGISVDCGPVTLAWRPAADPSGIRAADVELEKLVDHTYAAEKTWNNVHGDSVSFEPACDTHYRWRIRATDNAGNQGAWSGYQDFHVRATVQ